jgi:predicted TIM-barrel fold metal-dependent hydrolase
MQAEVVEGGVYVSGDVLGSDRQKHAAFIEEAEETEGRGVEGD